MEFINKILAHAAQDTFLDEIRYPNRLAHLKSDLFVLCLVISPIILGIGISGCGPSPGTLLVPKVTELETKIKNHSHPTTLKTVPELIDEIQIDVAGLLFQRGVMKTRLDNLEKHSHSDFSLDINAELEAIYISREIASNRILKLEKHSHPGQNKLDGLVNSLDAQEVLIRKLTKKVKANEDKLEALEFGINITNGRIDDLEQNRSPHSGPKIRPYKKYDKKPILKATITKSFTDCPGPRKPSYFYTPPRKRF